MKTPEQKVVAAFTADQLRIMRPIIRTECETIKNHIASNVEREDFVRAKNLVERLRETEACFTAINRGIREITGSYE